MAFTCEKPAYRVLYLITFKFDGEQPGAGFTYRISRYLEYRLSLGTPFSYGRWIRLEPPVP